MTREALFSERNALSSADRKRKRISSSLATLSDLNLPFAPRFPTPSLHNGGFSKNATSQKPTPSTRSNTADNPAGALSPSGSRSMTMEFSKGRHHDYTIRFDFAEKDTVAQVTPERAEPNASLSYLSSRFVILEPVE